VTLVASSRRLGASPALDLVGMAAGRGIFFDDGELQMAAIGEAARFTGSLDELGTGSGSGAESGSGSGAEAGPSHSLSSAARRWLQTIDVDDAVGLRGSGVLAFGAFPFDRSAPAVLVVPALLVVRAATGETWATTVQADGAGRRDPLAAVEQEVARLRCDGGQIPGGASGCHPEGTGVSGHRHGVPVVTTATSDAAYAGLVRQAVAAIRAGTVDKVVVTRQADAILPEVPDVAALIRRWRVLEPGCAVFDFPSGRGRFVGATPELLVSRRGRAVECRPLAGTSGGGGSSLLSSEKDGAEHRFVVDAIAAALRPWCAHLDVPDRPRLVALHTLSHLGTDITGTLREDGEPADALALAALLHPTPAVGGAPTAEALRLIARLEAHARGQYGGPVGWVDRAGDGAWWYGIRSAVLEGRHARLTAGVGIVDRSDPDLELEETRLKMESVLAALSPLPERRPGDSAA